MLADTDYVSIANAFGAKGFRIEKPEEIPTTVKKALELNGPVILEVIIDPDEKFPLVSRSLALKDSIGLPKIMKSISLESIRELIKMLKNREV